MQSSGERAVLVLVFPVRHVVRALRFSLVEPTLSVIIPAYNEAHRLPPFLAEVRRYLDERYPGSYEVIVIDDGSRDGLADALAELATGWRELVVLQHAINRGKGAAVRTGMLAGRGQRLLFADADGATPIDEEAKLAEAISARADVAVGSRLVAGAGVARRRTWARGLAGRLFAGSARRWFGISVRDTQCGFKMFRRDAARELFSRGQESGYLFDLELLVLADRLGYRVVEVPINWADVPGGHLSFRRDLGGILAALWRLRRRLTAGDPSPAQGRPEEDS
jgi:dolichyl-phosphate beta-glucosyltransferase